MPSTSDIQLVEDPIRIDSIRLAWNELLGRTRGASFFQTPEWIDVCCSGASPYRPFLVTVYDGGKLAGVLPLLRSQPGGEGPPSLVTPAFPPASFCGPVGPQPTLVLLLALRFLERRRSPWSGISLLGVNRREVDGMRTATCLEWTTLQFRALAREQVACVATNIAPSRAERWRRRTAESAHRHGWDSPELVRWRPAGAAFDDGEPEWERFEAFGVPRSGAPWTWSDDGTAGTAAPFESSDLEIPTARPSCEDFHLRAARCGVADVATLRLNGKPAAWSYAVQWHGRVHLLAVGTTPLVDARHREEVRRMLVQELLADSIDREDQRVEGPPELLDHAEGVTMLERNGYLCSRPRRWWQRMARKRRMRLTSEDQAPGSVV